MISMLALSGHTLAGKALAIVGGTIAGAFTFAISEAFTGGNLWIGVCLSALSSVAVAWFTSRPKTIRAQSDAEVSEREMNRKNLGELWARSEVLHKEETRWMRDRISQQDKLLSLMTITKHALLNECQNFTSHCDLLRDRLREAGFGFPRFNPSPIHLLTQEEDKARAQIMNLPAAVVEAISARVPGGEA